MFRGQTSWILILKNTNEDPINFNFNHIRVDLSGFVITHAAERLQELQKIYFSGLKND